MNKVSLTILFSFGILFSYQASAIGIRHNDIKKRCLPAYEKTNTFENLINGDLGNQAFRGVNRTSKIIVAVGAKGTIFIKVVKSGKVFKLNRDGVFELVGLESHEDIIYANWARTSNFLQLSAGDIVGLEYVLGTYASFWDISLVESSSEEESDDEPSQSEDSSDIYESSLDLPSEEETSSDHFGASELLRTNSFTGWEDERPLLGMYSNLSPDSLSTSPAKKKFKSCGSELNLCQKPKGDDNDGDEDYGRFLNFGM